MTTLSEKIIALHAEGKTYNQIKEILGCSKGTIAYHIGIGQKEKTAARRNLIKNKVRAYIQNYKQTVPCNDCGEYYPYWVMDFDHLENKSYGIAGFHRVTVDLELVKKEIEKCEVVCANCHRTRTHSRALTNTYKNVADFDSID